jgi:diguanylate cyclase (GGDEF)-like protein
VNVAVGRGEHVPLSDRLAVVQILRVLLAAAAVAISFIDGRELDLTPLVAVYVGLTGGVELLRRRARVRALSTVSWMLLFDGLFLALAVALTGGTESRIIPLVFFHVTAVTLIVSYRTGLKLAVWYALLLFLGHAAAAADLLGQRPTGSNGDATLTASGLLLFAIGAAACSSVNEGALRRSRAQLHALVELGLELERVHQADDLAAVLARHGRERLGFVRVTVLIRSADRWAGAAAADGGVVLVASPAEIGPLPDRLWSADAPALVRSLEDAPVLDELLPLARNVVIAPVIADGEALGVVLAEWGPGPRVQIPAVTVDALAQSASQTAVALRNAALLGEVEYLATRDGLTGLANRRLFEETLQREMARSYRRRAPLALVVLDVDHFKDVNDTAGHQAGDAVLREVGGALARNTKASDLAARYGGDEFVVLLPDCTAANALRVAERLRAAVAHDVTAVPVTVSAGVGAVPENAGDGERLVAAADAALYAAKGEGRNRSVRSSRPAEPGEAPEHPSLRRRPDEVDDATAGGAEADGAAGVATDGVSRDPAEPRNAR